MYAIIETGGKQLKVEEGQSIYVEKLDVEESTNRKPVRPDVSRVIVSHTPS